MGSETRPTISIICDDANTTTALRRMDAFGFPVHASVIVTRNPRFRSVSAFVDSHRDMLQKFDPGLHLDLFEGVTPKDKMHISGRNGLFTSGVAYG